MSNRFHASVLAFAICFLLVHPTPAQIIQGQAADRKLDSKFVGHWCPANNSNK